LPGFTLYREQLAAKKKAGPHKERLPQNA